VKGSAGEKIFPIRYLVATGFGHFGDITEWTMEITACGRQRWDAINNMGGLPECVWGGMTHPLMPKFKMT
jgi:hypothetical protein